MSAKGSIRHGDTSMTWDEYENRIDLELTPVVGPIVRCCLEYDGARELLDCLLALFARQEIRFRYPESR